MKQVEVTIMGNAYVLGCPEGGEAALQAAVAQVDREMTAIRDSRRVKARERIAVLAALNLAYAATARGDAAAPRVVEVQQASESSVDLDALVRRIEERLGGEGRLL